MKPRKKFSNNRSIIALRGKSSINRTRINIQFKYIMMSINMILTKKILMTFLEKLPMLESIK